ncbi:MAG TPA: MATE family efflux transporter [Gemmatimonadales bacterium]|nr:MATE family efflux transporter [Gemmatimonadales bacterium]
MSSLRIPTAQDLRTLLRLALPLVVVQVGMMAMGLVDTIMVGHLSAEALAAVALGNLYFFAVSSFSLGCLLALDPVVAQAVGAGETESVARAVQRGLVLAGLLSLPTMLSLWPADPVLRFLRQPTEVVPLASEYARISSLGVVGFLAFVVLRQTLQALGRMRPIVAVIVIANLVNAGLNWILIYGHLGSPAFGTNGSAMATVVSRWVLALGLLGLAWRELEPRLVPVRTGILDWAPLKRLLALGAPIGVQYQLEYGVFGVVGMLMGIFGTEPMAAHQVALNLSSITFMVPMGVSAAAAVAVGHAIGRGDMDGARRAAGAALACGVGFMLLAGATLGLLPGPLARVYTGVPGVVTLAMQLIPIAAVFQVFDGIQVVSIGILRGLGDTRTPMLLNILGFWLLGLPTSLALGERFGFGPRGLWWGLVVGLIVVGTTLLLRVRHHLSREVRRITIEEAQLQE